MPWDNNTGGGGRNTNGGGPWGQAPGGGGGGGGPRRGGTPSLEDILNRGRDQLGGNVPGGRWLFIGGAAALVVFWLFNSIYTISEGQVGVELQFGRPKPELAQAGLHFHWWPIEDVERASIALNQTSIGAATGQNRSNEGLMLSGDQNIVDVRFSVQWAVTDPVQYLFNVRDPEGMVRSTAESAMREVVGRRPAQDVFRDDQAGIRAEVQTITQGILDSYQVGVSINDVNIEQAAPPTEVADAFEEVQRAEQDETRFQEEARQYANTLLGNARGQAAQIREDAAAYRTRVVQEAEGEAARFVSIYNEYAQAPEVTRKRLFLETMEQVLGGSEKVIVEPGTSGSGIVPYLPLPALQSTGRTTTTTTNTTGTTMGVN